MKKIILGISLLSFTLLSSCKVADVRCDTDLQKVDNVEKSNQEKAKQILTSFIKKNGYDKFETSKAYQITAHEDWKGMMGKMGNPWPQNKLSYEMKFVADQHLFTNQVTLTSKKKNGEIWGMKQSFNSSYHKQNLDAVVIERKKENMMSFNLANYQWWIEFPYRLSKLKNISYAGEKQKDGQTYELVLATWGENQKANKKYDQYMLWFNKSTGIIDLVTFTYRNIPMFSPSFMYGTALLNDYKTVNGINLPMSYKFQINGPSKDTKYAHHFSIDTIEFNTFNKSELISVK